MSDPEDPTPDASEEPTAAATAPPQSDEPPAAATTPPQDVGPAPWWKRTPVIATAVVTVVAVVVGVIVAIYFLQSHDKNTCGPLPDAAQATQLVKQSQETTKNYRSVHLELKVDEGLRDKLPVDVLTGDLTIASEVAAKGTISTLYYMGSHKGVELVIIGDKLYFAITKGNWIEYPGPASDVYDLSLILKPDTGLANILANFTEAKADCRDDIGGAKALRITGKLSKDAVNKISPQLAVSDAVPATVWIREDGNHDLVRVKLEAKQGSSVQMTLSDWGKPVTVEKPE